VIVLPTMARHTRHSNTQDDAVDGLHFAFSRIRTRVVVSRYFFPFLHHFPAASDANKSKNVKPEQNEIT
jgi:hypothetical protein